MLRLNTLPCVFIVCGSILSSSIPSCHAENISSETGIKPTTPVNVADTKHLVIPKTVKEDTTIRTVNTKCTKQRSSATLARQL